MTIKVTKEDIELGQQCGVGRSRCFVCPVARAIKRTCPKSHVFVASNVAIIDHKEFMLPSHIQKRIAQFDESKLQNSGIFQHEPFEFELL